MPSAETTPTLPKIMRALAICGPLRSWPSPVMTVRHPHSVASDAEIFVAASLIDSRLGDQPFPRRPVRGAQMSSAVAVSAADRLVLADLLPGAVTRDALLVVGGAAVTGLAAQV